MSLNLMGKKRGMTKIFDEEGYIVPCTVIEIEPNVVTQIKTVETDGYNAIQTAYEIVTAKDPRRKEKRSTKPLQGHYKKAGVEPRRYSTESRVESTEEYQLGQELGVAMFKETKFVDAIAISKGKGFQGGMKLHNFAGGDASHGASKDHRSLGSTGMRSTPGRCFKGGKRASHMGMDRVTVQNLKVVDVIEEENLILVRGAVAGPKNGLVTIRKAKKKRKKCE